MADAPNKTEAQLKQLAAEISGEVSTYRSEALKLDKLLGRLSGNVHTAMVQELPWLQQHLPVRYSLDPARIDVHAQPHEGLPRIRSAYANSAVPIEMSVSFRILYDGKPCHFDHDLTAAQQRAKPACAELARRYNLAGVHVMGEPIQI